MEALGRLCRDANGVEQRDVLRQAAPMWLVQLPSVLGPDEQNDLQRQVAGATRERMLRELGEALDILNAERPLRLILEDLHWSDPSTIKLLSVLARRREVARLMVLGPYRPVQILSQKHPLRGVIQELQAHGQCEDKVTVYLRQRFPQHLLPTRLTQVLHDRTEGNPLFVVNMIEDLIRQNLLIQAEEQWVLQVEVEAAGAVPEGLHQLVARQREPLHPLERRILEATSVAGTAFATATVEATLREDFHHVEECCADLAEREQFLKRAGIQE